MNNKKNGTKFERSFAQLLSLNGWWVHLMTQNSAGQPFDIIAAKNGIAVPIDCKVCENDIFKMSRIEENQQYAMQLWEETGNKCGWFALQMSNEEIRMISHRQMEFLGYHHKVLGEKTIRQFGFTFDDWKEALS